MRIYQDLLLEKWVEVHDQSEKNYSPDKEIRIKTSMLRSDLCDYSDAYIVAKGDITLEGNNDANKRKKILRLKIMYHLSIAFQKLMVQKLIMQRFRCCNAHV